MSPCELFLLRLVLVGCSLRRTCELEYHPHRFCCWWFDVFFPVLLSHRRFNVFAFVCLDQTVVVLVPPCCTMEAKQASTLSRAKTVLLVIGFR